MESNKNVSHDAYIDELEEGDEYDAESSDEFYNGEIDMDDVQSYAPQSNSIRLGTYTSGPLHPIYGQRSALPIPDDEVILNYGDDPNELPQTAAAYLLSVRRQAASFPGFVAAQRPYKPPIIVSLNQNSLPSSDASLTRVRAPEIDLDWHKYVMTQYKFSRRVFQAAADYITPVSRDQLPSALAEWRSFIQDPQNKPTTSILYALEQEDIFRIFKYYQRWVIGNLSMEMSRWLYALLVRVADIFPADEMSILRVLCMKCISVKESTRRFGYV
ncbi:uncharacterized protein V1516DRAFT_245056 [Lipomyces oligophaga]|uniref:uncharacterized protein n=1 Tax=Lipomyces oligophaga TaxID=45792 RepID=UPI0034CF38EB